jgi:hypothetical protein
MTDDPQDEVGGVPERFCREGVRRCRSPIRFSGTLSP